MGMNRRQFLKMASISSILGFGESVLKTALLASGLDPPQVEPNKNALTAKRWAIVESSIVTMTLLCSFLRSIICGRKQRLFSFR